MLVWQSRSLNLVHTSVAGYAIRGIRITSRGGLSVYALPKFLHLIGVTLRAFSARHLGGRRHYVRDRRGRIGRLHRQERYARC